MILIDMYLQNYTFSVNVCWVYCIAYLIIFKMCDCGVLLHVPGKWQIYKINISNSYKMKCQTFYWYVLHSGHLAG